MTDAMTTAVHLPPGPNWPVKAQGVAFLAARRKMMESLAKKYGTEFTVKIPFMPMVVISDPALGKQLFQMPATDMQGVEPNLEVVFGPGSTFGQHGDAHRRRRKLLVPPFNGKRMRAYDGVVEEEALREIATWPEGHEFSVLESMMRITLNSILRAVFGAEGEELATLRRVMPALMKWGSVVALVPQLRHDWGGWSPQHKFVALRQEFDSIINSMIAKDRDDPNLSERGDVLSLLLQSTYEDGAPMSNTDIADELFTLLAAGHETTATSLAWSVERLQRHPEVLSRLADEVDAGGSELLQATLNEVQRTRPVIDAASRMIIAPTVNLGQWVIPKGHMVRVDIPLTHRNPAVYNEPDRFNPDRFLGVNPDPYMWIPFGGGVRRCIGASFANMEMTGVVRTMLREVRLQPTNARGEWQRNRGVAYAPNRGARVVVHRRGTAANRPG